MSEHTEKTLDLLATLTFTRAEYYAIIDVLYKRAEKLPLDLTDGAWYCRACGSTRVHLVSWVEPNENMKDAGSESPDDDTFCNDCEQHETAFHSDAAPLFCKCLAEDEYREENGQPKATWPDEIGGQPVGTSGLGTCEGCGEPYTTVRPEPEADPDAPATVSPTK